LKPTVKKTEARQPARKPSKIGPKPEKVKKSKFIPQNDLMIVSGKWIWIRSYPSFTELETRSDTQKFRVKYLTKSGQIKHCLARSSMSYDIKEAMLITGVSDP
jgi:hypothetical protein